MFSCVNDVVYSSTANMTTIVEQCRIGVAFVAKRFPDKRYIQVGVVCVPY